MSITMIIFDREPSGDKWAANKIPKFWAKAISLFEPRAWGKYLSPVVTGDCV